MYIAADLYSSADGGKNWSAANYGPRTGSYVYEVALIDGSLIVTNNHGIHCSTNGGLTWRNIYPREAYVLFDLMVKEGVLYCGTRAVNW